jgi:hypothetical protein
MVQGFLFDRVNRKTAGAAVTGHNNLVIQILPHKAEAALAFVQFAEPGAHITLDALIFQFVPIAGFYRVMGNKVSHCYSPGTVNK